MCTNVAQSFVVQVFVPYPEFDRSAKVLDNARLLKQLVEAYQLLLVICDRPNKEGKPRIGWRNHPATIAWSRSPGSLARYADEIANECDRRGIKTSTMRANLESFSREGDDPPWLGDEKVHRSHRFRLLQKDFEFYGRNDWIEKEDPNLADEDYWWPVPNEVGGYELRQKLSK